MTQDEQEEFDAYTERILVAARRLLLESGLRRTSLADIAHAAEVAEATLYRRFAGRDELLATLFSRESNGFLAQMDEHVAGIDDPIDRLVAGFVFFVGTLRRQELVFRLLQTDPDTVLPLLTTRGGPGLTLARTYVAAQMRAAVESHELTFNADPEQLAELLVRLAHSLLLAPESTLPLDDDRDLARFARATLVPMVIAGQEVR